MRSLKREEERKPRKEMEGTVDVNTKLKIFGAWNTGPIVMINYKAILFPFIIHQGNFVAFAELPTPGGNVGNVVAKERVVGMYRFWFFVRT
jgi:hypothetical protein